MTDTLHITNPSFAKKVKGNAVVLTQSYRTYVAIAATSIAGWWLHLDDIHRIALEGDYPFLVAYFPYFTIAAYCILGVLPQKAVTTSMLKTIGVKKVDDPI